MANITTQVNQPCLELELTNRRAFRRGGYFALLHHVITQLLANMEDDDWPDDGRLRLVLESLAA